MFCLSIYKIVQFIYIENEIIFLYLIEGEKNYYADNFRLLRKYFIPFVQSVHHHVEVPATDFHPKIIRQCCDNFFDWERGWGIPKARSFFSSLKQTRHCWGCFHLGAWFLLKHLQANSAEVFVYLTLLTAFHKTSIFLYASRSVHMQQNSARFSQQ